jgi:DNA replication and repair protein RecF
VYNGGLINGDASLNGESFTISCGLRRGVKKQFRRDKKDYQRLIDHIGLIPLVMISPSDQQLIDEGSDERRRFMDVVIGQLDRKYLDCLTKYNALLKQRNTLLKQYADAGTVPDDLLEVLEWQMVEPAEYIFKKRTDFFEGFEPYFERVYDQIKNSKLKITNYALSQISVWKGHTALSPHRDNRVRWRRAPPGSRECRITYASVRALLRAHVRDTNMRPLLAPQPPREYA